MFSYFLTYDQYFLVLIIACERLSSTLDCTSRLRCVRKSLKDSFYILNPFMFATSVISLLLSVGNVIFPFRCEAHKKEIRPKQHCDHNFFGSFVSMSGSDFKYPKSSKLMRSGTIIRFGCHLSTMVRREIIGVFVKRRRNVMESSIWIQRRITVSQ
ncbi:Protein CBG10675 [Caenorhabditis briggsae]|uniref:Protein CBG10675 n=1 Tax=Caenorhabditis briggsae TaxID=6238 RepID=A8XBJ7_CAEBR|nr:Protein CBG10675 [Caenorhabditis briggsae]CAP30013.1 Protein CBG10675 [Caenorhabditis briggsae]